MSIPDSAHISSLTSNFRLERSQCRNSAADVRMGLFLHAEAGADLASGPCNTELHKCPQVAWYPLSKLPEPVAGSSTTSPTGNGFLTWKVPAGSRQKLAGSPAASAPRRHQLRALPRRAARRRSACPQPSAGLGHPDGDSSRAPLEDQLALADALGQRNGRRDGGVPAERHLHLRAEVTDAESPAAAREQERRLGLADVSCDAEHGRFVQPGGGQARFQSGCHR